MPRPATRRLSPTQARRRSGISSDRPRQPEEVARGSSRLSSALPRAASGTRRTKSRTPATAAPKAPSPAARKEQPLLCPESFRRRGFQLVGQRAQSSKEQHSFPAHVYPLVHL